jgi:hypothetical protein
MDLAIIDEDNIKEKFLIIKEEIKNNIYKLVEYDYGYKIILKEDENVFIDLFLYKQNGDKFFLTEQANKLFPNEFYIVKDVFPIRQDDFDGIIVNIPNNCDPYLVSTFGKNYNSPKLTHIHHSDINIFDKTIITLIKKIPLDI